MKAIPSIVIVEPKLLQLTYDVNNLQYDYENGMFRDAFIERAQKITNALQEKCYKPKCHHKLSVLTTVCTLD